MRRDEPVTRIMTETVVVIEADRPVSEALDCLHQYGIHHLPVVRDGRIAGMLSSADVRKLEHFAPTASTDGARFVDERLRLEQLMHTPVVSVRNDATVGEVADLIVSSGVHALPVLDDADHVVGIVSSSDLIRSLLNGPPRRAAATHPATVAAETTAEETVYHRKPTDEEMAIARATAQLLHIEKRDPKHLGKALLYLMQRVGQLEKVLALSDRFLVAGQDERNHALLLKAILAAKRVEELATGAARVPFPLE